MDAMSPHLPAPRKGRERCIRKGERERRERREKNRTTTVKYSVSTILSVLCIVPKKLFKVNHPTPHRH